MSGFSRISPEAAAEMIEAGGVTVLDVRNPADYKTARISGAKHLDNSSLSAVLAELEKDHPCIICCYHGMASQQAAGFLASQGLSKVHSLDGGFETWRKLYPQHCEQ
jgi:thiosulfate sulfurtransferase